MNDKYLELRSRLNSEDFDDTRELMHATLETVEAGFNIGADKKANLNDVIYLVPILTPIQAAIDNGSDASRELALWSNEDFDREFEAASASFDLQDEQTEHDIRGLTKGLFHGYRMIVRIRAAA